MAGARNTELGCRLGQRHWRLSRARRELRQWPRLGDSGLRWELRETAAASLREGEI